MKTSSYFEKVLFHDDTAAIDDYFERRVGQLFEQSAERSYIEFHIQQPSHKVDVETKAAFDAIIKTPKSDSDLESDADSDPSSPTEQSCYLGEHPRYIPAPVLRRRISDAHGLSQIAVVSVASSPPACRPTEEALHYRSPNISSGYGRQVHPRLAKSCTNPSKLLEPAAHVQSASAYRKAIQNING